MIYVGDFPAGHTAVCIPFASFAAATGASSATSNFAASDVLIYKDLGTTQRSSSAGITVSTSFDSQTGLNAILIDLSDNTDSGFYAAGHEYQVAVADITIDSQTVRFWAGCFSIERAGGALALIKAGVTVASIANNAITAAAIATDAIDADAIKADAVTEIQSGLATASALSTLDGKIDTIDTNVDAILADTNELQTDWANGGRLDLILDARASQTSVDDLPTNAELASALASADDAVLAAVGTVDSVVDAIKVTTDKLDDTLEDSGGGAYIFTTDALAQAPSGSGASAADIADAVWDEATADHQTAGTTGKALTDAQSSGNPWATEFDGLEAGEIMKLVAAFVGGKTTVVKVGNKLHTVTFRSVDDSADRIVATVNNSQRTAVTLTP